MDADQERIEKRLADIWRQLYGEDLEILPTDSFFGLGGTSILAVRLVERVRQEFDVDFRLKAIIDDPTLRGQLAHICNLTRAREGSETGEI